MPVSQNLLQSIAGQLSAILQRSIAITGALPVSGGDINDVYSLHTNAEQFLIKLNSVNAYPDMFLRESEGLAAIHATDTVAVPRVILQIVILIKATWF